MELKKLYLAEKERLRKSGSGIPDIEISIIASETLGVGPAEIYGRPGKIISPEDRELFRSAVQRRMKGEPVGYITGRSEFFSRTFLVNRDVLIPRPETEVLVEKVLDVLPYRSDSCVLDVGSGSGCISVTLALERSELTVVSTDVSYDALLVSRTNAIEHGVNDRILFMGCDLVSCIKPGSIDILVSNPPYISTREYRTLQSEVRDYEPSHALLGGDDGMDIIKRLVADGRGVIRNGGLCFLETGYDQAEKVREIFGIYGYTNINIYNDLNGIKRVVSARWKK